MSLSQEDRELVSKLVGTNFKGFAQVRLSKLAPAVLDELVRLCSAPKDAPLPQGATSNDKVVRILEAKKEVEREHRRTEKRSQTPAPPEHSPPPGVPGIPAEAPPPPPDDPPKPAEPPAVSARLVRPVFRDQHELNIVAFNSLKLRLDRDELEDDWDAAILEFSKYDVLMLSEVRASDKLFKARAQRLVEMLNDCTDERWTVTVSEPSGPGAKEVHLIIAKAPVDVVAFGTLAEMDGQAMDHAPLVATLQDRRFVGELRRINLVSVHMPPKTSKDRRSARDAQIRKLTSMYVAEAKCRLGAAFSNQAAKETRKKNPYTAHIVGGDFNADAKELRELDVERHGWELQLGSVRTSSGGKSYDNWLINRDCKDHLTVGADVLDLSQFANFSKGQQGISDHAPITLRIKEIPRFAPPAPAKTRAEMRKTREDTGAVEGHDSPAKVEQVLLS